MPPPRIRRIRRRSPRALRLVEHRQRGLALASATPPPSSWGHGMDKTRSSNPLILLLTLSVVAATVGPRGAPQTGRGEADERSALAIQPQATDYRGPFERFLGPTSKDLGNCHDTLTRDHLTVRALIATLPDPSNPRLADAFDSYLASIQSALAQGDYLADQFWLPWIEERDKKDRAKNRMLFADGDHVTGEGESPAAKTTYTLSRRRAVRKSVPLKEQPGVMLFRRHPNSAVRKDELLAIVLVGETPTNGIRSKPAFRRAVEYAKWLSCALPDSQKTIRIIGPSFSGPAYSLSESILDWLKDHPEDHFRIVTGSATNASTKTILERVNRRNGNKPNLTFTATVQPDSALSAFYDYLALSFGSRGAITMAMLTESNTSYGQGSFPRSGTETAPTAPAVARSPPATPPPPKAEDTPPPRSAGFVQAIVNPAPAPKHFDLPFPLHIAQLGAEYEKARSQSGTDASALLPSRIPHVLGLNLAEDNESSDVVPALSPMTRSSSDLSLANSLAVISRAHVSLVGIVATDPRDEVFLAEAVHRAAPDTQIFLTKADLLFTHPLLADDLRGAIVVSRYPLHILNQLWSPPRADPDGRRLQSSSGSAKGVDNPTIVMLREFDETLRPIEYGMPFANKSSVPPLWVGIVGHEAILPVRVLGPPDEISGTDKSETAKGWQIAQAYVQPVEVEDKNPLVIFPPGNLHTTATALLFTVLASLMAWAFPLPRVGSRKKEPRAWMARLLSREPDPPAIERRPLLSAPPAVVTSHDELRRPYASVQLLAWQALAGIYFTALAPLVAPLLAESRLIAEGRARHWPPEYGPWLSRGWQLTLWGLSAASLLLFIGALYVRLIQLRKSTHAASEPGIWRWQATPLCWVGGAIGLALSVVYAAQVLRDDAPGQIFLWVRTANWLSGVSPALPLVCLGLGVIATATSHLRRIEIAATERGAIKLSSLFPSYKTGLEAAEARAAEVAEGRYFVPASRLAMIAVATATVLWFAWIRPTVEAYSWTLLMEFLFAALVIGVAHGLVLLAQAWHVTRRTLDQLAGHPIARTYLRLRESLTGMIGLHPYAAAPRLGPIEARIGACVARLSGASSPPDAGEIWSTTTAAATELETAGWERRSGAPRTIFELRSELVALQAVRVLLRRISAIRALVCVLTIDALVLLLATRVYPFQPQSILSSVAWALLLCVMAMCVWTLLDMERNALLSYMSGSEPGKITWDVGFISQMIVYAGLPILALVAAHFPEVGKPLFDWIRPLAGSVK